MSNGYTVDPLRLRELRDAAINNPTNRAARVEYYSYTAQNGVRYGRLAAG